MDDSNNPIPPPAKTGDFSEKSISSNKPADGASPQGQKRKWEPKNKRQQQGAKRHKGRDMGRQEYNRSALDKRQRNAAEHEVRQQKRKDGVDDPKGNPFTQEEIEGDARQPKRKVAVMMGYAGSGYKGMQMMPDQKTIEGDLFEAFVKAGAISKANADDPKKSAFVRCARTDKGVHAAGNVISLKLIIEDENIVQKINENLPAQIRVWGIERTIGSFSCYQACDSRWYEYLIPTHCFLPPHPKSYMGQRLPELAEEAGDMEGYKARQAEMEGFWEKVEEERIRPLLEGLDADTREKVEQALYHLSPEENELSDEEDEGKESDDEGNSKTKTNATDDKPFETKMDDEAASANEPSFERITAKDLDNLDKPDVEEEITAATAPEQLALRAAIKSLKDAYLAAKREWRIPEARLDRVRDVFARYKGTHNFHNYTVRKSFRDPSAKRHILSFKINPTPIIIGDTEWLSLKVHGQSFMMHQIRKMVGLAALVVRSGADVDKIMTESFTDKLYSIPKAPALGLLLERPVFDNYNSKATKDFEREAVAFTKYEKEMEEFKRKEVYERIFGEEDRDNVFHSFFTHVDNYRTPIFLYLSSKGLEACGDTRSEPNTKRDFSRKERGIHQNKKSRNKENAWKAGQAKD